MNFYKWQQFQYYLYHYFQDEDATTLISLLKQVDLVDALKGEGPFTVFAPTNEAFSKLDPNLVSALTDDEDLLKSVLLYHVVPQKLLAKHVTNDITLDTLLENNNSSQTLRVTQNLENDAPITNINGAQLINSLKA